LHNLFLKSDGTVVANGYNNQGQSTVPATLSNVVAIAAEGYFSLALLANGQVVSWGDVSSPPAGVFIAIAGGPLVLSADGTVPWRRLPPVHPTNVVAIASSESEGLFLLNDGSNVIPFSISSASRNGNGLVVSVPTERGRHYVLLASDSLKPLSWNFVAAIAGDGSTRSLIDPAVSSGQRFYRVIRQ